MSQNVQKNIIIGADAQQFNKAMGDINRNIKGVDQSMKGFSASTVAGGTIIADVFRDVGRAIVNYIQGAVESAQKLPPGIVDSVDALRDARTEAEKLDVAIGVMATGSMVKATEQMGKFKGAWVGFNVAGG